MTSLLDRTVETALKPLIAVSPGLFTPGECAEMRHAACQQPFDSGRVLGEDPNNDFRKASVCYEGAPELENLFLDRAMPFMMSLFDARVHRGLRQAPEIQLTATEDGGYFKPHTDNSQPGTEDRTLSFVFYFGQGFSGGMLHFLDYGYWVAPVEGLLVVFNVELLHEIEPTRVESGDLSDSRLTLNGWLR